MLRRTPQGHDLGNYCRKCGTRVLDKDSTTCTNCKERGTRLLPYTYKRWRVHHYTEGTEQFIACYGSLVLRGDTKEEIEKKIDNFQNSLDKLAST